MKFLVFQHVLHEHPGLIAKFAKANNIKLDIVELWKPYKIPIISNYDALIIMGGPMGVYENKTQYPSKNDEIIAIKQALNNIPILGFCLGSQLLAYALGADVHPNIKDGKRVKEIGYCSVNLTNNGRKDSLFKGFSSPIKVLQWHGDAFELPRSAKLLATSPLCQNQAFSYKNAYGLLFHFEFTPEMVAKQIELDRNWIHQNHEIDENQLLKETKITAKIMEQQCQKLFANFLSIVQSRKS
ncbi:type 1 glutamine amidotransferase [Candidatus Microgenomates bacterium]|nr:type 1 glutamine amidotransferase [Candidatus Microgenomates bacterium]